MYLHMYRYASYISFLWSYDMLTRLQIYSMYIMKLMNIFICLALISQFICFNLWLIIITIFMQIIANSLFYRCFKIIKKESCKGDVNSTVHILCCQNNFPRSDLLVLVFLISFNREFSQVSSLDSTCTGSICCLGSAIHN